MRFDMTQPYSEVFGIPGVRYEQRGRRFSPGGVEMAIAYEGDEVITSEVPDSDDAGADAAPEPDEASGDGRTFGSMHWKQLKALVETYDHEWVDKADAVRFLEGVS